MLLEVKNLNVGFLVGTRMASIIHQVSFEIDDGEVLGMIGETGCGKSVTGSTILHLLPDNAVVEGQILYKGRDITHLRKKLFHPLRGSEIVAVPQSPSTSLDPLMRVGTQVEESVTHRQDFKSTGESVGSVRERVRSLFKRLLLPGGGNVYSRYPCELSGGMCQRILIAMGVITRPSLLVLDEPTKGIDWILRKEVVELMEDRRRELGFSMLLITHDITVAREMANRIAVMYAGEIVEIGPSEEVLDRLLHPYTEGLIHSQPQYGFQVMKGFMPAFDALPPGCRFSDRCPYAAEHCSRAEPELYPCGEAHYVRCFRYAKENDHA